MRLDLEDDPAVILIAARTNLDPDIVIGKLYVIWAWANRQTTNGKAHGVTLEWVDAKVRVPGFGAAMVEAKWLKETPVGIVIPKFARHNGQPAKTRGLTLKRVRRHREKKRECNAESVTESLPQQEAQQETEAEAEKSNARSPEASTSSEARTHGATDACLNGEPAGDHACVACRFPRELLRVCDEINRSDVSPRRRQAVIGDAKAIARTRNPMPIWKAIVKRAATRSKNMGGYIANAMADEAKEPSQ